MTRSDACRVFIIDTITLRRKSIYRSTLLSRPPNEFSVMLVPDSPIEHLDFALPVSGLGGKIDINATNKAPPETTRTRDRPIKMSAVVVELVTRRWVGYGVAPDQSSDQTLHRPRADHHLSVEGFVLRFDLVQLVQVVHHDACRLLQTFL